MSGFQFPGSGILRMSRDRPASLGIGVTVPRCTPGYRVIIGRNWWTVRIQDSRGVGFGVFGPWGAYYNGCSPIWEP